MLRLAGRRIATAVPLMLAVSFFIFALIDLAPGDPALRLAGDNPTPELVEQIRKALQLDRPLLERYASWVAGLVQGDLGTSFATGQKVTVAISGKLPVTASLAFLALLISIVVGPLVGALAALRPGGLLDRLVTVAASVITSIPSFWLGILLVVPFAITRPWFPALGYAPLSDGVGPWLRHLTLPAIALAMTPLAETALQLRGSLGEVLQQDYILAARARGMGGLRILAKHALKNAAIPVVTILGLRVSFLLGGAMAIEQVFVLNGIGSLAVASTLSGDVPVLLGLTLLAAAVVAVANLMVDISYGYFNPKVRD